MLKKKIFSILFFCVVLMIIVNVPAFSAIKFISIATGSTGGTYYPVGVILATTFGEELSDSDYRFSAHASGGSSENLEMLRNKEVKMAIIGGAPTSNAFLGIGKYEGKTIKNIRFVTALWPEAMQIVYRKNTGIKTLADFPGRKIAVGPAGGGGTVYLPILLKQIVGLTFDDFQPQYLGYGDSAQAMQNRLIDACFLGGGFPTSAVSQLYASQVPVDIVEFTDEDVAKVKEVAPYFAKVIIPKGTYPKQERDLNLMAVKSTLVVEENVEDDIVYKILETIYIKRLDEIKKKHGALKTIDLDQALLGLSGVPLHPGAVKFYKDHGIDVPGSLISK
jgi:TRAP transporter TAXI family solute receptor